MQLEDFLAALGESGNIASAHARAASLRLLDEYLEPPDEDGIRDLKTRKVRVTLPDGKKVVVPIPEWAALTGGVSDLDRLVYVLRNVRVKLPEGTVTGKKDTRKVPASNTSMTLRRGGAMANEMTADVRVEFKMGRPPELLGVLRDKLTVALMDALTATQKQTEEGK